MSIIDNALKANRDYAKRYDRKLGQRPAPKIAVVTCMDPRLSDLPEILGLPHADLDVIRTRIHHLHRRRAEREAGCFDRRPLPRSHALFLL
jgi:carbonic anhydrase